MSRSAAQCGVALLESLVAIAILSFGLAASAALLVQAIFQQREAAYRSVALLQAVSLADVLRSLRRTDGRPLQAVAAPGTPPDCPLASSDCSIERSAQRQISLWREATEALLPAGSAAPPALLATSAPAYGVSIAWRVPGRPSSSLQLAVEP